MKPPIQIILDDFFGKNDARYVCIYEVPGDKTYLISNVSDIGVETVLENIVRDFKEGNFTR